MNPDQSVQRNVTVMAWPGDGEKGLERCLVVKVVVLEVDVAAHDGGDEGDCVREVVVVVLVACPRDHRRHVFVPHATNRKTPSKMSIRTKELETMAGKKKVGEAQRVSETWGTRQ